MKIMFSDVIKQLRQERGISQEVLANEFGITVQAVSKWENKLSCPDISLLPLIAGYFGVSIDYLLTGVEREPLVKTKSPDGELPSITQSDEPKPGYINIKSDFYTYNPDNNALYIARIYRGNVIGLDEYDGTEPFAVSLPDGVTELHIYGNTTVEGNINGNVNVCGDLSCGDIGGSVQIAGGDVDCGDVGGNVSAGGDVDCGDIGGSLSVTGGSVSCDDVEGDVSADGDVSCGVVEGDINVNSGNVECDDVEGDISVYNGSVICSDVEGNIYANSVERKN
ncbi:MAG: helix-turn-helix domain-containing protein [Eubacteriales bacterium]|jgi:transcriptional regulator with XRE-family HTH domain|nr:helix-turn-helix domain-containing protein [Clostridiales bacterium]